jgi:hypothetical protein
MPHPATLLPPRRSDLVIRPLDTAGRYVVKDPQTGAYFQLGEEEHFLLGRLDGRQTAVQVGAAFVERFAAPLSDRDLEEFVGELREQGLLRATDDGFPPVGGNGSPVERVSSARGARLRQTILC